jgi:hypothetical protein
MEMTAEQIAIVAAVFIALINATWQARVHRQTLDSQHKLTVQERTAGTYEDTVHMIRWVMELVDTRKPILEYPGLQPPQEPDIERVRTVQARIGAHGSQEVKAFSRHGAKLG